MNKNEMIAAVAEKTGVSKAKADLAVNTILDTVQETLRKGDKVQIPGFGTFEVKERAARTGRNPKTGDIIEITACKTPSFRPGKMLKEAVQ